MTTHQHIAFLGIGLMGRPMVENLLAGGFAMTLWNRTRAKAEPFAEPARIADSPAQAVAGADVVITMLENGEVVESVLMDELVLARLKSGALVVDMSSIPPSMAREHGRRLRERGLHYVDAPVSGGTLGAEKGTLSIMAGGEAEVLENLRPVFRCLGSLTHVGPVGAGQVSKLANQAIVGITIGAVSEALMLAESAGADPEAVRQALLGGFAGSRILELHGRRMLERDFQPGAPARIQHKDLTMILEEAHSRGLHLPLSSTTLDAYRRLLEAGHGDLDHSSLLLELERLNG